MIIIESKRFLRLFGTTLRGCAWFPGIIIVNDKTNKKLVNHEKIHIYQQLELLYFGFIIMYLFYNARWNYGYRNNPFEVEAFGNDDNLDYLKNRKWYAWRKHTRNKQKT